MEMTMTLIGQILAMVLMALAGFIVGKARLLTEGECRGLSKACVYIIVPCALVDAFRTPFDAGKLAGLGMAALMAAMIHGTYLFMAEVVFQRGKNPMTPGERGSVIYSNSGNLIIPLVQSTLGSEYAIYICAYLLVQNLLTWTHGQRLMGGASKLTVKTVLTSPNILSILLGLTLFFLNVRLPGSLGKAVSSLGACLGPLCMVMVGILLSGRDLKQVLRSRPVWRAVGVRLLLFPLMVLALLWAVHLLWRAENAVSVLLVMQLCASGPSASLITQLAQLYDCPEKGLVSSVNALSTLMCALTMPLMCVLFQLVVG